MPPAAGMRCSAGRCTCPEACAADEEHRELAGVREEVMFATKPQLAGSLLERAQSLGIGAAFVAGDEVYGRRELRRSIRQRGMGYVLAVRANHTVTTGSGRTMTAAGAAGLIPARAWQRMRTGSGTNGTRRRRHQHRARQAHQRWNAYAETTPMITTNYSCRISARQTSVVSAMPTRPA